MELSWLQVVQLPYVYEFSLTARYTRPNPVINITIHSFPEVTLTNSAIGSLESKNMRLAHDRDSCSVLYQCRLQGYTAERLEGGSKPLTAFVTQDDLFEFNKMAFGLHNAPATFQRTMLEVLRGLNWKSVL